MKPITTEWIEKAESDYKAAAVLRNEPERVYDAISFDAQQCVEKYLKAWLSECEIDFPRTHDITELLALLPLRLEHSLRNLGSGRLDQLRS